MNRLSHKILPFVFLLSLSFLISLRYEANLFVELPNLDYDPGVFQTVAMIMQKGGMPYLDTFDHKGPLLYLYHFLGMNISYYHGLWFISWMSLWGTFSAMYATAHLLLGKFSSCLVVAIASAPCYAYYRGGGYTQEYSLFFIAVSLYLFAAYFRGCEISKMNWGIIGASFMAVALLQLNLTVPFWIFIPVILWAEYVSGKNWKFDCAMLCSGMMLVGVAVGGWLYSGDALSACWRDYIEYNFLYMKTTWRNRMSVFWMFLFRPWILLSIGFLIYKTKKTRELFDVLYLIYASFLMLSLCLSGRPFGHYAQVVIPFLAYPLASFALFLEERITSNKTRYALMIAAALISVTLSTIRTTERTIIPVLKNEYSFYDVRKDPDLYHVIEQIQNRTDEEDTISVYGHTNTIYVNSHRLPASRYSFPTAVIGIRPGAYEEYLDDLRKNRPKLIIVSNYNSGKNKPQFLSEFGYKECYQNSSYGIFELSSSFQKES